MKPMIGIFSDSHDNIGGIDKAFAVFRSCGVSEAIHAGDWVDGETIAYCRQLSAGLSLPVYGVIGNNDSPEIACEWPGFQIAMTLERRFGALQVAVAHGHRPTDIRRLLAAGPDILVRGHSHRQLIEASGRTVIINPGSVSHSIPRRRSFIPTVVILDPGTREAQVVQLA